MNKKRIHEIVSHKTVKVSPTPSGFECFSNLGEVYVFKEMGGTYKITAAHLNGEAGSLILREGEPLHAAVKKLDDLLRPKWEEQKAWLDDFLKELR